MASKNPVPKEIKLLRGTARKDREPANPLSVSRQNEIPLAPEHFTPVEAETWHLVCAELVTNKMLYKVDLKLLEAYCYNCSLLVEARNELEKKGGKTIMMQNKGGGKYPVISPWLRIYNEALSNVIRLAGQFGFTPSARMKISAPADSGLDDLEKLMGNASS